MQYMDFGFGRSLSRTVKALIIANVAVFLITHIFRNFAWFSLFGFVPRYVFTRFMLWQFFTYMFLHGGLWHLAINMLMLFFFGPDIEMAWGRRQFLFYYFFTGVGAAFCSFVTAYNSTIPVVGASGAIFGLLVAYCMLFPDTVVLMFFFFPMNIRYAVLFLAGLNLLGAISNPGAGIAYFAHLGGAAFGYLYLKNEWIRFRLSAWGISNLIYKWRQNKTKKRERTQQDFEREVDRILDKVHKYGMDSLNSRERKILEDKSRS